MDIKRLNDPYGEENWDEPKKNIINGEIEKVRVYVMLSGDYCAFHEVSLHVVYDITNDHPVGSVGYGDYTKKQLDKWKYTDYSDVQEFSALKVGKKYYVLL
jgi:hypothetical protein